MDWLQLYIECPFPCSNVTGKANNPGRTFICNISSLVRFSAIQAMSATILTFFAFVIIHLILARLYLFNTTERKH